MRQGLMLAVFFCINLLLSFISTLWFPAGWGATACSLLTDINIIWILVMTYYMTRFYCDMFNGGTLTYWQGFMVIVSLYFFASIITAGLRLALLLWKPEFLELLFAQSLQAIKNLNLPETTLQQLNQSIDELRLPANFVIQYIWVDTLLGLILALPMALLTRRKTPRGSNFAQSQDNTQDDHQQDNENQDN